jgi:hypothetical protein
MSRPVFHSFPGASVVIVSLAYSVPALYEYCSRWARQMSTLPTIQCCGMPLFGWTRPVRFAEESFSGFGTFVVRMTELFERGTPSRTSSTEFSEDRRSLGPGADIQSRRWVGCVALETLETEKRSFSWPIQCKQSCLLGVRLTAGDKPPRQP